MPADFQPTLSASWHLGNMCQLLPTFPHKLPIEGLLWGAIGVILSTFWSVVGCVCTLMLLVK